MQTRAQFLATGLVPVQTQEDYECSVCLESPENPVKLPCGHIFCRECIEKWLTTKRRNACPMCNRKFFDLPSKEDTGPPIDRREQVAQALRLSGLAQMGAADNVETYGSIQPTVSALQRGTAQAVSYLGENPAIVIVSGPAVIRSQQLAASLAAIGNLIPALACVERREYSGTQKSDWKMVLHRLQLVLNAQDGKKFDALILAQKLREKVEKSLKDCYSDIDYSDFFFTRSDPAFANRCREDLDVLLSFLTRRCWIIQREEAKNAALQKGTKAKQQKTKGLCAVM